MKVTYNNPFGCDRHTHQYPTTTRRRCPHCGHEQVVGELDQSTLATSWVNVNPTDWVREEEVRRAAGMLVSAE